MHAALPLRIMRPPVRTHRDPRHPRLVPAAALGLVLFFGPGVPNDARASPPITIVNALPASTLCATGNTISVFAPDQQVVQPGGNSLVVRGSFDKLPGIGIQVNSWYWT